MPYKVFCIVDSPNPKMEKALSILPKINSFSFEGISIIFSCEQESRQTTRDITIKQKLLRAAYAHEKIIESFMQNGTVIPFNLYTYFATEDKIYTWLARNHKAFKTELERLKGKSEMRMWLKGSMRNFNQTDKIISQDASSPGRKFMLKKKQIFESENKVQQLAKHIFKKQAAHLKPHVTDHSIKVLHGEDFEIKIDFLINIAATKAFQEVGEAILASYTFKKKYITGPWPIYHFISQELANNLT